MISSTNNRNPLFLGLDQGTSSTKAALISSGGEIIEEWSFPISFRHAEGTRIVEQDGLELVQTIKGAVSSAGIAAFRHNGEIAGVGLSCQRSSVCAWNHLGVPLSRVISWADLRFQDTIETLVDHRAKILAETGLPLTAHYAATKLAHLQHTFSDHTVRVSTLDSLFRFHLGEHPFETDHTLAARTLLYSHREGNWSNKLCTLFGVDSTRLPKIAPSIGFTRFPGSNLRVSLGDQQAGLIAAEILGYSAVLTLGTIGSVCILTGSERRDIPGFVTSILASRPPDDAPALTFLLEGVSNSCGQVMDWLLEKTGSVDKIAEACLLPGETTCFCPIGNTGTPHWHEGLPWVRRGWNGDEGNLVRGIVESIGCFIVKILQLMLASGELDKKRPVLLCGGLSQLAYLPQFIADATGLTLVALDSVNLSVLGVAWTAAGIKQVEPRIHKSCYTPTHSDAGIRYQRWLELEMVVVQSKGEALGEGEGERFER